MAVWTREVLSSLLAATFAFFAQTTFMAYLGIHLTSFQATGLMIGFIFGLRNIVQIFFRVPIGEFSQIIGRKPLIILGMAFYSIAYVFMYLATDWKLIAVATLSVAVGMSLYYPALFAYIGDISKDNYGKINGIIFQGSDISIIIGLFFVKELLERNIVDLQGVFAISFVISVYGTLISMLILPEVLSEENRIKVPSKLHALKSSFANSFSSFKEVSRIPELRTVYRFQFVISFGEFFVQSFFPLLVVTSFGYPQSDVAKMLSYATVILLISKPFLGSISDKFGFKRPVLFALFLNSFLLIAVTYVNSFTLLTIIFALLMMNIMMSYLGVNGATSRAADPRKRGVAMGVLGVWVSIGRSLSSFVLGPIWAILEQRNGDAGYSLRLVFRFAGLLLAIFALHLYTTTKNLRDQELTAEIQDGKYTNYPSIGK